MSSTPLFSVMSFSTVEFYNWPQNKVVLGKDNNCSGGLEGSSCGGGGGGSLSVKVWTGPCVVIWRIPSPNGQTDRQANTTENNTFPQLRWPGVMITNSNIELTIQDALISHSHRGPDFDTMMEGRKGTTVRDLLVELYDKAGQLKQWWLVRHTAGKKTF